MPIIEIICHSESRSAAQYCSPSNINGIDGIGRDGINDAGRSPRNSEQPLKPAGAAAGLLRHEIAQWTCIVLVSTATHFTYSHSEHMKVYRSKSGGSGMTRPSIIGTRHFGHGLPVISSAVEFGASMAHSDAFAPAPPPNIAHSRRSVEGQSSWFASKRSSHKNGYDLGKSITWSRKVRLTRVYDASHWNWNQRAVNGCALQGSLGRRANQAADLSQRFYAFGPLPFNAAMDAQWIYGTH